MTDNRTVHCILLLSQDNTTLYRWLVSDEFDFDKLVGSNVQRYRVARGMSQADLAAAISEPGEHIHQQTIQKVEKGSRPLKFSEARKISRALKLGLAHLTDDVDGAVINAAFIARHSEMHAMHLEVKELAERLAPLLKDLADLLALARSDGKLPSPYLVEFSETWLQTNWGKDLNVALLNALREHPGLSTIRTELDASTYAEVLAKLASREWRDSREMSTEELEADYLAERGREDASET